MAGIYISNNREVFNRVTHDIVSDYPKQQKIENINGWYIAFFQKIIDK